MSDTKKGFVGVYQFARESGLSVTHLYKLIYEGKLPAKKLGRKWQIPEGELAAHRQQKESAK